LEPQIDYTKLEKAVMDSIDIIQSYQAESSLKLSDQQRSVISALIKKFKVKELKIWVGQKDYKLYKVKADFAAPSVKDFTESIVYDVTPALGSARADSRDAKRIADVRQLATVMELYYNDFGGYPVAQNGVPQGVSPAYIGSMPVAPTPTDGTCTDYYNAYWYSPEGKPSTKKGIVVYPDYSLTFCLGDKTGSYPAGIGKLTRSGIENNIACPTTAENCVKENNNPEKVMSDEINKMTFTADIVFEAAFKDYGVIKELKEPEKAVNLIQLIKGSLGQFDATSDDYKRLTDVKQISLALELYLDSNKRYPENLDLMVPDFLPIIPIAPTATGETCSNQDNTYTYKPNGLNDYEVSFCLSTETGGYTAGKHILTMAGIK
jgi:hypothetical protein